MISVGHRTTQKGHRGLKGWQVAEGRRIKGRSGLRRKYCRRIKVSKGKGKVKTEKTIIKVKRPGIYREKNDPC